MTSASLGAIVVSAAALGDILIPSYRMWVWDGGMAVGDSTGGWMGTGWNTFPGVNPPWNQIGQAGSAPSVHVDVPWNSHCAAMDPAPQVIYLQQPPPPATYTFYVAGQSVTVPAPR